MRLQTKLALLILSLLLSIILVFSFYFQSLISKSLTNQLGGRVLAIAETVASIPEIRQAFSTNDPSKIIQPIAEKIRIETGAEFVVVGNEEKVRYSHPVPDRIGEFMVGKDNDEALRGKRVISQEKGTLGPSLRGIVPVYNQNGQVIGVVAVGFSLQDIENITMNYRNKIIFIAVGVILVGIIGALLIARGMKRSILGLEPNEITHLYQENKAVLESIKEGIVAVNLDGTITMVNQQAINMLHLSNEQNVLGSNILEQSPYSPFLEIIQKGEAVFDREFLLNDEFFIANYMPIRSEKGNITGWVSSFRSKSELYRLTQELSQVRQYSEALRAQTHEYSNKLYMISGLIQLESYQEAIEFIASEFDIHQNLLNFIKQEIPDIMIGGLLIGKFNQASELKIHFEIDRESSFKDIPVTIERDSLTTIIGNLIDNAMEAVMKPTAKAKNIKIFFSDYEKDLIIEVEDLGIGILPEHQDRIFERGFSTKTMESHGIGLFLVQKIIKKLNGYISYSPNPEGGSIFTVIIPKS
ncbi:ATP-binding protein [Neobacillus ginsengisoli]|uniref:histidine kinase n=1 Tax=Neobacillus ginsengisoli TaxID=904295 RepID=A0ABT9XUU2_9BACI|nr:sensor histidine kinase [Neobacillus ginsengisoli]MDQ0199284.1 two-component system CitB family sensor kinase [Neobacillus ginsengisoli]